MWRISGRSFVPRSRPDRDDTETNDASERSGKRRRDAAGSPWNIIVRREFKEGIDHLTEVISESRGVAILTSHTLCPTLDDLQEHQHLTWSSSLFIMTTYHLPEMPGMQ